MNDELAETRISNIEQRIDLLAQEVAQGKQGDNVQNAQLPPFVPIARITGEDKKPFDIETDDEDAKSVVRCIFYWGKDEIELADYSLDEIPASGNATLYLTRTISEGEPVYALTTDEPEEGDEDTAYYKIYDFTDGEVSCDYRATFLTIGGTGVTSLTGDGSLSQAQPSERIDGDIEVSGKLDPNNDASSCGIEFVTVSKREAQGTDPARPARVIAKIKGREPLDAGWGAHSLRIGESGQPVKFLANKDFVIPESQKGDKGDKGDDASVEIETEEFTPTAPDAKSGVKVTLTPFSGETPGVPVSFNIYDGKDGKQGVGIGSVEEDPSQASGRTRVYKVMSDEATPQELGTLTVTDGQGIGSVVLKTTSGKTRTYSVMSTDTPAVELGTFTVTDGEDGKDGVEASGSDYIEVGDGTGGTTKGQVKAKVPTDGTKGLVTTDTTQTVSGAKTFSKTIKIAYDSNGEGTYFPNAIYFKPKEGSKSWIAFYDSVTGNNVVAQVECNTSGRLRLISTENGMNVEAPATPHIYLYDRQSYLFLADIFARNDNADGVAHPLILKGDMYGSGTVAQIVIGHDATTGQPAFKLSRKPDDTSDVNSRDLMTLGNANDKFLRIANIKSSDGSVTITPSETTKEVDLSVDIPDPPTIPDIEVDTTAVTFGKAVGGLTVDETNKHKIIASAIDIPAAQIQSDWNQTDSTAKDFIKNKPTISEQVNADWNATSGKAQILNKPESLKNPYALTIKKSGSYDIVYDGSEAKEIALDPGGVTKIIGSGAVHVSPSSGTGEVTVSSTVRNLIAGSGISLTASGDDITITNTAQGGGGTTEGISKTVSFIDGFKYDVSSHKLMYHFGTIRFENGLAVEHTAGTSFVDIEAGAQAVEETV